MTAPAPWRVREVRALPGHILVVRFPDGTSGTVEMKGLVESGTAGVFAALRDPAVFNQAHLEYGAVTWPGGIDLAPDAMYDEIKKNGKWVLMD